MSVSIMIFHIVLLSGFQYTIRFIVAYKIRKDIDDLVVRHSGKMVSMNPIYCKRQKIMITDRELITVIMATYNGSDYIKDQLESIYEQSVEIGQVIISDDGSEDNTVEIVQTFIEEHKLQDTWRISINQTNMGPAANFIKMCKEAKGDYIFFSDQDDIWMPEKVESMVNIIKGNSKIGFLYADVINTANPNGSNNYDLQTGGEVEPIVFSPTNYFFKGLGCATCITRKFMKHVINYWIPGWEHDMFFWSCAILLNSGYKYNTPVIWRRIHSGNVSMHELKTLEKRTIQVEQSISRPLKMKELLKDNSIDDTEKTYFLEEYDKVLRRRYKALKNRDVFLALINILSGKDYYLHKTKGAILDIVLIVFKQYSM